MQFRQQQKSDAISRELNWLHLRRLLANDVPFFASIQRFEWCKQRMHAKESDFSIPCCCLFLLWNELHFNRDLPPWTQEFQNLAKLLQWNSIPIDMPLFREFVNLRSNFQHKHAATWYQQCYIVSVPIIKKQRKIPCNCRLFDAIDEL